MRFLKCVVNRLNKLELGFQKLENDGRWLKKLHKQDDIFSSFWRSSELLKISEKNEIDDCTQIFSASVSDLFQSKFKVTRKTNQNSNPFLFGHKKSWWFIVVWEVEKWRIAGEHLGFPIQPKNQRLEIKRRSSTDQKRFESFLATITEFWCTRKSALSSPEIDVTNARWTPTTPETLFSWEEVASASFKYMFEEVTILLPRGSLKASCQSQV